MICETTNGVGAKIQLSLSEQMYEELGYDLFAMCANDMLESGAEPVAFLDYIACGKLKVPLAGEIVRGISEGCRDAHCALVGELRVYQLNRANIFFNITVFIAVRWRDCRDAHRLRYWQLRFGRILCGHC